jgi:hypothetical protein
MSRSSARKAQVEPVAALVAVAVLGLAVGAYATVRADVLPGAERDAPANAVLAETVDAATTSGAVAVSPSTLEVDSVAPAGYEVSVTITAGDSEWTRGAEHPPPDAASDSRRVPVRVAPGQIRPGRVTVVVWS